ncbi:hypothetical protein FN976_16920 [Caenimonas sedimenti]|uniref:Uncharacterized protein n=1 Tax=Caenimonas sedimenti TaxID=2596921 RepID=A0A562ZNY8_9BURK|nr:S-4TM family putative pore-forming effector [Caenimonas sedimenti]TWO70025.1 hypothetical protein FN976_16920 [Caenimonas sedimenti]
MNDIPVDQDRPEMIDLLRARDRVYRHAKWLQGSYVVSTIVIAIGGTIASIDHKPIFGLLGIIAMLLDVSFLDQYLKKLCKLGARLAEEFDTGVLKLPANPFVAEKPVPPEDIRLHSVKALEAQRERQFTAWYEVCVGEVPLAVGRLICQRLNGAYDSALRKNFSGWLVFLGVVPIVGVFLVGTVLKLGVEDVVVILAALMPALNWALREARKHLDIAAQQEKLRSEFDRVWARALAGADEQELEHASRQLQDAIYHYRASTTLIFDWFYQRKRPVNEDMAAHVARRLVDHYLRARQTL